MSTEIRIRRIEPLGDHEYLVELGDDSGRDPVAARLRAEPEVVDELGLADRPEPRVVQATADFLISRQEAWDLPDQVDLFDIAAGYPELGAELRRRLDAS
ncbi:hypothetical protein ACFYNO_09360 [Kitasatospora sp. NPDC006697]|uniref:hypothetical protein n=1 Tax=Kitasatospora sp. NPDC006697 TaxID=3364020 RepID=UPI00367BFAFA